MKNVTIALNALEPSEWTEYECEDVRAFLRDQFPVWPKTARIYHKYVSQDCDVTPVDEETIERLGELEGPFTVVVYPGDPFSVAAIVIGAILVGAAIIYALTPKVPAISQRANTPQGSPNNDLSDRENAARINQRIADIYGTVRSTPDLLAAPYKIFENNREIEVAYMCIGRGSYEVSDVRDDTTRISQIFGAAVEVYPPNTSPNSGSAQLTIGGSISYPLIAAKRSNAVNGQELKPSDNVAIYGVMRFVTPNKIQLVDTTPITFTDRFAAGDNIQLNTADILIPEHAPVTTTKTVTFENGPGIANFTGYDPTADFSVDDVVVISTPAYSV